MSGVSLDTSDVTFEMEKSQDGNMACVIDYSMESLLSTESSKHSSLHSCKRSYIEVFANVMQQPTEYLVEAKVDMAIRDAQWGSLNILWKDLER